MYSPCLKFVAGFLLLVSAVGADAQTRELRVCAAPDNIPFSSRDQMGFENRIAALVAMDAPAISIHGLSRTDVPDPSGPGSRTTGSGEPALTAVAPAIANAFFDATGARLREAPMTPSRVRGALKAAGVI